MVRWNPNRHNSPTELREKQGLGFADLKGFTEPYPGEENFVHGVITVSLHWGALLSLFEHQGVCALHETSQDV